MQDMMDIKQDILKDRTQVNVGEDGCWTEQKGGRGMQDWRGKSRRRQDRRDAEAGCMQRQKQWRTVASHHAAERNGRATRSGNAHAVSSSHA